MRRKNAKHRWLGGLLAMVLSIAGPILAVHLIVNAVTAQSDYKDAVYDSSTEVWTTIDTIELAAMGNQASTEVSGSGGVFLSSGAFIMRSAEDQSLHYIEELDDGGYVMGSISAENAVIYEIDEGSDETPRIETRTCHLTNENPEYQAWLDEDDRRQRCPSDHESLFGYKGEQNRVYVPTGTIVDTFTLDVG